MICVGQAIDCSLSFVNSFTNEWKIEKKKFYSPNAIERCVICFFISLTTCLIWHSCKLFLSVGLKTKAKRKKQKKNKRKKNMRQLAIAQRTNENAIVFPASCPQTHNHNHKYTLRHDTIRMPRKVHKFAIFFRRSLDVRRVKNAIEEIVGELPH